MAWVELRGTPDKSTFLFNTRHIVMVEETRQGFDVLIHLFGGNIVAINREEWKTLRDELMGK